MNKKLLFVMLGLPFIVNAMEIVPLEKMDMPPELKESLIKRKQEEKAKGYYETDSIYARHLNNIKKESAYELNIFGYDADPYDTHLKMNLDYVKLAFKFKPLSFVDSKDIIGYAVGGAFIQNKGWSGIKVYFNDKDIGYCSYSYFNLKLSDGSVQLSKENTEFIVRNKPSSRSIEGNAKTGYLYSIHWYTKDTMSMLECANMTYNKDTITKVIELANKIENTK